MLVPLYLPSKAVLREASTFWGTGSLSLVIADRCPNADLPRHKSLQTGSSVFSALGSYLSDCGAGFSTHINQSGWSCARRAAMASGEIAAAFRRRASLHLACDCCAGRAIQSLAPPVPTTTALRSYKDSVGNSALGHSWVGEIPGLAGVPAVPFRSRAWSSVVNHILLFLFLDNRAKVASKEWQVSRREEKMKRFLLAAA